MSDGIGFLESGLISIIATSLASGNGLFHCRSWSLELIGLTLLRTITLSAISSGSVRLMNSFYKAKRTMMEHGFFHTSIDLKLPHFAQPVSRL